MKNKFIKSTIILMIGTFIAKLLGFIIKIILTRIIGIDGISIYSLIMPTYSLLIMITQLSLPYSISILVSKNKYRSINILSSIIPIALIINMIIIFFVLKFAPYLANNLLNNNLTYYPIISICFVLPFTTLSGIIKGYYFGKQNMLPNAVSSIFEQLTRLLLLVIVIPKLVKINLIYAVSFYIFISAISEIVQIIVYLFFMPKKIKFNIDNIKINNKINKEIMDISLPNTSKSIIGNICYFLEPIILTKTLLHLGYTENYISLQYGIYNAYVIPLLTIPTFFTSALNTCLMPEISKNYNNKESIKKLLHNTMKISLIIGIIYNTITFFFGNDLIYIIYNTKIENNYIKILSLIFPIFYLTGPIISTLQSLNYSKFSMLVTLYTCIIKLIVLIILSLFSIGIYGLVISEIISLLLTYKLSYMKLKKNNYL